MSNPAAGTRLPFEMTDPRWPAADGWVKMSQNVNGVEIHYVNLYTESRNRVPEPRPTAEPRPTVGRAERAFERRVSMTEPVAAHDRARWTRLQKLLAGLAVLVWSPILIFIAIFIGLIVARWIGQG